MNHTMPPGSENYTQRYNIIALNLVDILVWELLPGMNTNLYIEKQTVNIKADILYVSIITTSGCVNFFWLA